MEEFSLDIVARKSIKGVFALISRTFFIQLLGIFSTLILGAFLSAADFGVFVVVSAIVVFLNYFQDIGLAAALIQKKEQVTTKELRTAFTVQQILVLAFVIPTLLFSQQIAHFYKLGETGYWLLIALVVSFFLSSLRTIPTVIMERSLNFNKLVIPQILENLAYYSCLIFFSIKGFGVTTFTIAVGARSIVGLLATYLVQTWPVGISFHFASIKHLIKFGIPFQTNSLLALLKDDFLILYIGRILPLAQVGYIGFAQKWAFYPLRLIMDNVIKITFPSMSRLQHDTNGLKLAVEKSLFLVSFIIFPIAVVIIQFSKFVTDFFPIYAKWEPAILSLSLFSLGTIFSSISTPLTNFLTAIGKVKITLYFMVFWTIATWILTPFLVSRIGFNGFALASLLISSSSIAVFYVAKKHIQYSIGKPILRQLFAALIMFFAIQLTKTWIAGIPSLILLILLSVAVYFSVLFLLARDELVKTARFIIISIRSKE